MRIEQGLSSSAVRVLVGLTAVAVALFTGTAVAAAPVIQNGGFETGSLMGWKTKAQPDRSKWIVYTAESTQSVPPPPQGKYAVRVEQGAPSAPTLIQTFHVPRHATLKLFSGYGNLAPEFATPPNLNARQHPNTPNQQYRIDVIRKSADARSLAKRDVLLNVFRTNVGDPQGQAPQKITADLSKLAGKTVKLRFVTANNQGGLDAEIDGVKVTTSK